MYSQTETYLEFAKMVGLIKSDYSFNFSIYDFLFLSSGNPVKTSFTFIDLSDSNNIFAIKKNIILRQSCRSPKVVVYECIVLIYSKNAYKHLERKQFYLLLKTTRKNIKYIFIWICALQCHLTRT